MANEPKKYVGLESLQTFKENLDNKFATKETVEELSADVAYINVEDNENIPDVETGETISTSDIVQGTGDSITKVMSQAATTNAINNVSQIANEALEETNSHIQNKVTEIAANATDEQYPTVAAVKHYVDNQITEKITEALGDIEAALAAI